MNTYVEKGQRIYVAGRLVQNSWQGEDGKRRYSTEIHASEVVFLDSASTTTTSGNAGPEAGASPF